MPVPLVPSALLFLCIPLFLPVINVLRALPIPSVVPGASGMGSPKCPIILECPSSPTNPTCPAGPTSHKCPTGPE
jgi:hypothetical protein